MALIALQRHDDELHNLKEQFNGLDIMPSEIREAGNRVFLKRINPRVDEPNRTIVSKKSGRSSPKNGSRTKPTTAPYLTNRLLSIMQQQKGQTSAKKYQQKAKKSAKVIDLIQIEQSRDEQLRQLKKRLKRELICLIEVKSIITLK